MTKRIRRKPKTLPSKSELVSLYVDRKKPMEDIAKMYNVSKPKIRKLLSDYGIKISRRGEWALGLNKDTHPGIKKSAESKIGVPRDSETIAKIKKSGTMFEKGHVPWMKGRPHSEKTKKEISNKLKGKPSPNKGKKGPPSPFKGQTKNTHPAIMKRSISATGKKRTDESKKKMSDAAIKKFEKNPILKIKLSAYRANQKFPSKDSKPEKTVQSILRDNGISFRKHKNFKLSLSNHQADIVVQPNHVIEVFGDYWHFNPKKYDGESVQKVRRKKVKVKEVWEYDRYVIDGMKDQGYKVLVVWESELKGELEKTAKKILRFVND